MNTISKKAFFKKIEYEPHRGQMQIHAAIERAKIVAASCGARFGKCQVGNTEVYDLAVGKRRRVDEPGELLVQSWNEETLKSEGRAATAFLSGRKKCVRVTLSSGQQIELSYDHPMLTEHGWVEAALVQLGSLTATPRHLPDPARPLQVTDAELVALGCLITDGGTAHGNVVFTQKPGEMLEQFKAAVLALGGKVSRGHPKWNKNLGRHSKASAFSVSNFLGRTRAWGIQGCKSNAKRLPAEFYGLATDQIGRLLAVMWACDGWFQTKDGIAGMTLSNRLLLEDIRHLLLRLGVHSRIKQNDKVCTNAADGPKLCEAWKLSVTGAENLRLLMAAMKHVPDKQHYVEALKDRAGKIGGRSDTDVVPVGREQIKTICKELGRTSRDVREGHMPCRQGARLSRAKFQQACATLDYDGQFALLASSDVLWSKIESVEAIGEHDVYDLSVEETHNFAANNVIIHNTMCAGAEMAYEAVLPRPNNRPTNDFMGWCISPTHKLADKVWEETYDYLCKFLGDPKLIRRNRSEGMLEITNLAGGRSRIMRGSTDQADHKKRHVGYAVDFMVVDEASDVSDGVWDKQLSTRLLDRKGKVLLISTPTGKQGFFAAMFRQADREEHVIAVKLPTWINPYIDKKDLLLEKRLKPLLVFQQEYCGEFVAAEGQVFTDFFLDEVCVLNEIEEPSPYEADYIAACDLAMSYDYTVLMIARTPRPGDSKQIPRVVYMDRFHKLPIEHQISRIGAALERYGNAPCKVDASGLGDPIVQQMRNAGLPVQGVKFDNDKKRKKILNACTLVERRAFLLPSRNWLPMLHEEMSNFEWKQTPSGLLTAAAPSGSHDDIVTTFLLMSDWFPAGGTQGEPRFHKAGYHPPTLSLTSDEEAKVPRREMAARGLADPNYRRRQNQRSSIHSPRSRKSLWRNSLFS